MRTSVDSSGETPSQMVSPLYLILYRVPISDYPSLFVSHADPGVTPDLHTHLLCIQTERHILSTHVLNLTRVKHLHLRSKPRILHVLEDTVLNEYPTKTSVIHCKGFPTLADGLDGFMIHDSAIVLEVIFFQPVCDGCGLTIFCGIPTTGDCTEFISDRLCRPHQVLPQGMPYHRVARTSPC